jgi:hypothetical protein
MSTMRRWPRFAALTTVFMTGLAQADGEASLEEAIAATKPIIDLRLRSETVDQDPIVNEARAITLRARLGFETGKAWDTSLLIEGEGVVPQRDDYRPDPLLPKNAAYPVVADPEDYEINRLQLTNTSLPGTTLTIGRQRINLDDQRFVGAVGWRQNEQTFDAVRVVNRSVKNLVIDVSYFDKVNRVFGHESPQGRYDSDSHLINVGYQTKIGKVTGFAYLLDFGNLPLVPAAVRDSTATYGVRFAGEVPAGKVKLGYAASYATQSDYEDNPLTFDLFYKMAEFSATFNQFNAAVGTEILEGDVIGVNLTKGFTTPLATLHKFQGWADKFLTTPGNGIEDRYVTLGVTFKKLGPVDTLSFVASRHEYEAERIDADYGDEWNLSIAAKVKRVNAMVKWADYSQGIPTVGRDTEKLWLQLEFVW